VTGGQVVPPQWQGDLRDVLITEAQLGRRVVELAHALTRDYAGKELLVVPLLTGTIMFLADLLRHLALPLKLDFMGVSSYREGTESRDLVITKDLRLEVRDRHVLLVDDILDTGRTLACVQDKLRRLKPRSLRTCVLLDKPSRRVEPVQADYVGFVIPDLFVVGYGLDFAERYRNLPFVGVLRPELYAGPGRRTRAADTPAANG
jgi:hypoxanthine phosphoribosyltransferase